jgi:energy-coupling factor transport system substrate-specific component
MSATHTGTSLASLPENVPPARRFVAVGAGRFATVATIVCVSLAAVALAVWAAVDPSGVDWGTASFGWVAAIVAVGFALYGVRAVPAQEIALVAALSALATASRVLFASLPNVKPVTFIVLVSGIGLGPGAGFMVGATTALVSNFFFGQGPWTPWQMVGWGLVGVAGGLMGRRGRRPGRWEIVLVGSVLSLGYGWFVTLWMFIAFSAHTWPALVALYIQGLPFDAAHVAATAVCAALFGPQAVAIVTRFRTRTRVTLLDPEECS